MFTKIKILIIPLSLCLVLATHAFAQEAVVSDGTSQEVQEIALKDTDVDGLSDQAELNVYNTDPNNWDSDGDSYFDGNEVVNNANPLDSNDTPISKLEKDNIKFLERDDPLVWYVSRVAGIVSFILFTIVVIMGLVQSSRSLVKIKIMGVQTAFELHRTVALIAFSMLFLHFGALFFDEFFKLRLFEIILPFQVTRDFKSVLGYDFNLTISLGIVGLYAALLLIFTSQYRAKIVSMKTWRAIHYLSFAGYPTFIAHGYLSGTDSKEIWMQALYIVSLVIVVSLIIARIFRKKLFMTKQKSKETSVNSEHSNKIT